VVSCELVFLGGSGAIQVPSFHFSCEVCEVANPRIPVHRCQKRAKCVLKLLPIFDMFLHCSPYMDLQVSAEYTPS